MPPFSTASNSKRINPHGLHRGLQIWRGFQPLIYKLSTHGSIDGLCRTDVGLRKPESGVESLKSWNRCVFESSENFPDLTISIKKHEPRKILLSGVFFGRPAKTSPIIFQSCSRFADKDPGLKTFFNSRLKFRKCLYFVWSGILDKFLSAANIK